jgi:hypothetical protein
MGGELRIGELGERHEKRAAAAAFGLHLLVERVEQRQDALARRPEDRCGRRRQPLLVETVGALDVRGDQVVLGGEQPVEGGGGHVGLGGDGVDAGGANAVPVEQLVGHRENVLARLGGSTSRAVVGAGRHVWFSWDLE